MRYVLVRLCAVFIVSAALVPATSGTAGADTGADLSVAATWVGSGGPKAALGEDVTYAITLTNLGPDTAAGVVLFPITPDQFNPVSFTCSDLAFCSEPGGELAPGAVVTATVVEVVCCFPKGDSRTTSAGALVISTTPDPNLLNNAAPVMTRIIGPYGFFFPG
jgi:uncharacterized repeat protein (TIGR01451 family)